MSLVTYGQKPLKTAKNVKIHQNRPSPSLTKPSKLILGIKTAFSAQQHSNCQHKHTHHIYYPYELAPRRYGGHNTTNEAKIRQNTLKSPKSKLDEAKQASSGSQASLKKNSNGSELRETRSCRPGLSIGTTRFAIGAIPEQPQRVYRHTLDFTDFPPYFPRLGPSFSKPSKLARVAKQA